MDHTQLKCFISVARTLSFSEAARRNYVSQSTVSRYILGLEKEFGVKLFERNRREVVLTNEGSLLLPYAQDIIDTINKATSVVSQLNSGSGGRLRIACDATSVDYPTRCLRSFAKLYPDIAIDMVRLSGSDVSAAINSSDHDFYFMMRDMLPDNNNLNIEVTSKDKLSLLVPNSFKNKGNSVDGTAFKNQKFILLSEFESPILYMEIMDIFRTFHFSPDSVIEFDDVSSIRMAVEAEMGVSVLPSQLINGYQQKNVKVLEFSGIETDLIYAVAWKKDNSNPAAHLFLNTVKERITISDEDDEYVL